MTEQDKQALIKHFCSRDCGEAAEGCTIMPCHEIELIQEFPTTDTDSDTISRAKAIETLMNALNDVGVLDAEDINTVFQMLPPAQPERIKGHWIIRETSSGDTEARCSHCGFTTLVDEPGNGLHMVSDLNFCPNCGVEMEVTT